MASDLYTIKQQFAGGEYRESLQGCLAIMTISPACTALDQALYYAALNSLRIDPDHSGRTEAAQLSQASDKGLPQAARIGRKPRYGWRYWHLLKTAIIQSGDAGTDTTGSNDSLKKKDQEIKRLRSEIVRLNREIDMLKNVDVQLHRQKKDLD